MRGLELLAPAPAGLDACETMIGITPAFARVAKPPFTEKRDLLRAAVCEIVLEGLLQ